MEPDIKASFEDYLDRQLEAFGSNISVVIRDFDDNAIHDARLAMKRIVALRELLKGASLLGQEIPYNDRNLRNVYKAMGRLRDIQVQEELFKSFILEDESGYAYLFGHLKQKEEKAQKKLHKLIDAIGDDYHTTELRQAFHENLALFTKGAFTLVLEGRLQHLLNQARWLNVNQQDDENLHEVRKNLKRALFLISAFDTHDIIDRYISFKGRLKEAGDLLGDWHDRVAAIEAVKLFLAEQPDIQSLYTFKFKYLLDLLTAQRARLYGEIHRLITPPQFWEAEKATAV